MEGTPTTFSPTYSASPQAPMQQAAPKSDKFWKITTIVLIVVLAFFAFRGSFSGNGNGSAGTGAAVANLPSAGAGLPSAPSVDMAALADDDPVKGDPDAPVTIIEFSDYQCPFCRKFWTETLPSIQKEYIDTGKVKLVYRDLPLDSRHPAATPAAEAAECVRDVAGGSDEAYFKMHDKIFQEGNKLDGGDPVKGPVRGTAQFNSEDLKQWAKNIGYNIDSCLDSGKLKSEVQKDLSDATAVGVQGTPYFIINGRPLSGAQPFQVFQQVIEGALAS